MEEVQPAAFPREFNWVVKPCFIIEKIASPDDLDPFLDAFEFPARCTPMLDKVLNSKEIFLTLDNNYWLNEVAVLGLKGVRKERIQLMKKLSSKEGEVVYALTNGWNQLMKPYCMMEDEDKRDLKLKLQVWASFLNDTKMLLMCIFIYDDSNAEKVQQVPSTSTSTVVAKQTFNNAAGSSTRMRPPPKVHELPMLLLHELRKRLANNLDALIWLGTKSLTASDANKHQNRLYLPCPSELKSMMTKKEIQDAGKQTGVEVIVIDQGGNEWELKLRFWKPSFALTGDWKLIVNDLGLEPNMEAEVWIFRGPTSKLSFALSFAKKVEEEDEVEEEDHPSDSLEELEARGGNK